MPRLKNIVYFGKEEDRAGEIRFLIQTKVRAKIFVSTSRTEAIELIRNKKADVLVLEYPAWIDIEGLKLPYRVSVVMIGPIRIQEYTVFDHFLPLEDNDWTIKFIQKLKLALVRKRGPTPKYPQNVVKEGNGEKVYQGLEKTA